MFFERDGGEVSGVYGLFYFKLNFAKKKHALFSQISGLSRFEESDAFLRISWTEGM